MPTTKLENGKFYWQGKRDMSNYETAFKAPFLVYSAQWFTIAAEKVHSMNSVEYLKKAQAWI